MRNESFLAQLSRSRCGVENKILINLSGTENSSGSLASFGGELLDTFVRAPIIGDPPAASDGGILSQFVFPFSFFPLSKEKEKMRRGGGEGTE